MDTAIPTGHNQTTIATPMIQNQNQNRRVCFLGITEKLSSPIALRNQGELGCTWRRSVFIPNPVSVMGMLRQLPSGVH
jgi:hypothetical protein